MSALTTSVHCFVCLTASHYYIGIHLQCYIYNLRVVIYVSVRPSIAKPDGVHWVYKSSGGSQFMDTLPASLTFH